MWPRAGAAPAGVERRGGTAEAAAGADERQGRQDQRLECGAEFRGGGWVNGISSALVSGSKTLGGL
jgi:hypothetical protein